MSTPIETNTEELQEILQTVYNLPLAGGGSSEPDLVIGLDTSDTMVINGPVERLSFDSAAVISAYNKLLSGETVNCVLNAKYHIDSGPAVSASSPQITAYAMSEPNNSARVGHVYVCFNLWYGYDGFWGTLLVQIGFNIHGDNTASADYLTVTESVPWASLYR